MTAFCIVSGILFLFLFLIWSKDQWINFIPKMIFGIMMVWAIVCTLVQLGFHR